MTSKTYFAFPDPMSYRPVFEPDSLDDLIQNPDMYEELSRFFAGAYRCRGEEMLPQAFTEVEQLTWRHLNVPLNARSIYDRIHGGAMDLLQIPPVTEDLGAEDLTLSRSNLALTPPPLFSTVSRL